MKHLADCFIPIYLVNVNEIKNDMEPINSELHKLVRSHFPSLNEPKLVEEISKAGQLMHAKAGTVMMDYGRYITMVPLVISGSIKVVREGNDGGHEIFLYFLKGGETCSMSFSCCMASKKSDIRTIAEDDVTFIGLPIKLVDEWMMKYKSWNRFVMSAYDNRMLDLVEVIDNIVFNNMEERLKNYLTARSEALNSKILLGTHQQIALDLNSSREGVSRILKKFEKSGAIILGRNRIELNT